jgi:hypothetical protein
MSTSVPYTLVPAFILEALSECLSFGIEPSLRAGEGGNSHSVWFIKFTVRQENTGGFRKLHDFEVKVTRSYQQFLEFTPFSGPSPRFDGLLQWRSMRECIKAALDDVAAQA